ncbi:FAD-dependent oxidoreductase [Pelomonas sp. P7]|uniref:FAD-dependent oxidoreductase n=1 Tax=Pelomonas caseinilytica TaxID=2906763 RepID=A0ABS8X9G9_9BURK|nr:FAD-dependent oxidoreductase [Pelomonas sp. P7]MCE4535882.1 FAD-dependent oxidoreductase [Pelomonas sp. P7]
MRRIAVVGSGIAGLAAAWRLANSPGDWRVTLLEAGNHFGGHAHTVDLGLEGLTHGVDTGFLVFNRRTYPGLVSLFAELGVESAPSDMSFSVQVPQPDGRGGLEWSGTSLNTVFAQRSNLLRPGFWRMLGEILRFNRLAMALAADGPAEALQGSIRDFLDEHRFSEGFRRHYLLPMIGCIWSCPTDQMLRFPLATLVRFCHNHGLIQVTDRPQWYTVRGGSREYVRRMVERLADARLNTPVLGLQRSGQQVRLLTREGAESFDAVVLACHSDQALALLGEGASPQEREVLGAIRYQPNLAVLHSDTTLLPRRRAAWAAWNYERADDEAQEQARVCLHYLLNRLQPLPWRQPVIVSLNPARQVDETLVHRRIEYSHPVFDLAAVKAQQRLGELQGRNRTWFCGAWCGHGFHEDGLQAGLAAADGLREALAAVAPQREASAAWA